jgi:hypothetical protein
MIINESIAKHSLVHVIPERIWMTNGDDEFRLEYIYQNRSRSLLGSKEMKQVVEGQEGKKPQELKQEDDDGKIQIHRLDGENDIVYIPEVKDCGGPMDWEYLGHMSPNELGKTFKGIKRIVTSWNCFEVDDEALVHLLSQCPDLKQISIVSEEDVVYDFFVGYWLNEVGPTATCPEEPPYFLLPSYYDENLALFANQLHDAAQKSGCACRPEVFFVKANLS